MLAGASSSTRPTSGSMTSPCTRRLWIRWGHVVPVRRWRAVWLIAALQALESVTRLSNSKYILKLYYKIQKTKNWRPQPGRSHYNNYNVKVKGVWRHSMNITLTGFEKNTVIVRCCAFLCVWVLFPGCEPIILAFKTKTPRGKPPSAFVMWRHSHCDVTVNVTSHGSAQKT